MLKYTQIKYRKLNMNDTTLFERHSDSFTSNIGLYYCGKRIETKNHVYGPEIRSHYLIVFVEKGKATLYRNKQKISFGEGQMLIMFPGEKIFYKAQTDWTIRWIGVNGEHIDVIFALLGISPEYPIWTPPTFTFIPDLMEQLYVLQAENHLASKYQTQSLLCELFAYMLATVNNSPRCNDAISTAKKIISFNYNNNLSIRELAKKVFLQPAYFSRLFKRATNYSPKEYITKIRLEKAKESLQTTKYSIKNIATTVGFKDSLYFSRIFIKYESCSPTDYRKNSILNP
jgi:AraC-like DNA-binding protein